MPSPFPGMDPYLEGYLWPDVHQSLASEIRKRLVPRVLPRYAVRLAITNFQDESPESEVGIIYPDVEVLQRRSQPERAASRLAAQDAASTEPVLTITPPKTVPLLEFEVRMVTVEVIDTASNELVTSIEILSPYNKRQPGLDKYRAKQRRLRQSGVHILEIDLLRRGTRPLQGGEIVTDTDIFSTHYLVTLIRSGSSQLEAWPIQIEETLPVVAIPLRTPDKDIPLDLSAALATIYDEAAYDLTIDYAQVPPPPAFEPDELQWIRTLISTEPGQDT